VSLIDEYLQCRHSQRSFARTAMGGHKADLFDADLRATLSDLVAEGAIEADDSALRLSVETRVT
jgi:hypothetical protein